MRPALDSQSYPSFFSFFPFFDFKHLPTSRTYVCAVSLFCLYVSLGLTLPVRRSCCECLCALEKSFRRCIFWSENYQDQRLINNENTILSLWSTKRLHFPLLRYPLPPIHLVCVRLRHPPALDLCRHLGVKDPTDPRIVTHE